MGLSPSTPTIQTLVTSHFGRILYFAVLLVHYHWFTRLQLIFGKSPQRKWYYSSNCLPVLLYGLEDCPLSKSDLQSLNFVVNRFLMKLFKASNYDIGLICDSRNYLCFCFPSDLLQNVMMYSWLNSVVSNLRMIVIVNDSYYRHFAYDIIVHVSVIS